MAEKDKVFYWLKLRKEFMNGETIDFLMSQKNGANYVVLYQMLIMQTLNTEGELCNKIGECIIPFNVEKIQRDCKWFDIDTILVAMELYAKLGLIYKNEKNILQIANFDAMVGSETYWAKIKRNERAVGQCPTNVQNPLISNNLNSNIYNNIENKKEDNLNIISKITKNEEIFNYWNLKNIIKHKELTEKINKQITKAIKEYGEEKLRELIDRYSLVLNDKKYYFDTKWTLEEFLKQGNAISSFTDEGSKWINYQKFITKQEPKENPQQYGGMTGSEATEFYFS